MRAALILLIICLPVGATADSPDLADALDPAAPAVPAPGKWMRMIEALLEETAPAEEIAEETLDLALFTFRDVLDCIEAEQRESAVPPEIGKLCETVCGDIVTGIPLQILGEAYVTQLYQTINLATRLIVYVAAPGPDPDNIGGTTASVIWYKVDFTGTQC